MTYLNYPLICKVFFYSQLNLYNVIFDRFDSVYLIFHLTSFNCL